MGKKKYLYVLLLAAALVITLTTPLSVVNKFFVCAACAGGIYIILTDKRPDPAETETTEKK